MGQEDVPAMTRLRDRVAAGLTVDVPEGPDAYRAAGWMLRLLAILGLAVVAFSVLTALFLLPFFTFVGGLAGDGFFSALTAGFAALVFSVVAVSVLLLLVANHLHIGWSARSGWALWGTRAFTGALVLSSLGSAFAASGSSDPVAALSGLGVGTLILGLLHVLTWMEGTREAFRGGEAREEDVDATLET